MIVVIVLIAIAAPLIAPHDPLDQSVRDRLAPPSFDYPLGRDDKGRDILSRVIYGTRIALMVGIFSVLLGGVLGTVIGVVAGYFGGKVDAALMRLTDVLLAFPDLITGLLVLAVLGPGLGKMILAIGLTIAPRFARIAYGPTLALKGKEFIEAARSIGVRDGRLLRLHILPNVGGDLARLRQSVDRLGDPAGGELQLRRSRRRPADADLGPDDPRRHGASARTVPLYSLGPGLALLVTVFAFNLVGDGLRDVLDPEGAGVTALLCRGERLPWRLFLN